MIWKSYKKKLAVFIKNGARFKCRFGLALSAIYFSLTCIFCSLRAIYFSLMCIFCSLQANYFSLRCIFCSLRANYFSLTCIFCSLRAIYFSLTCIFCSLRANYFSLTCIFCSYSICKKKKPSFFQIVHSPNPSKNCRFCIENWKMYKNRFYHLLLLVYIQLSSAAGDAK